jgi:peptidoglycan hydrolase FlgJ
MSIFPATDIVSDVARAADPQKVELGMKRLATAGGIDSGVQENFRALLKPAAATNPLPAAAPAWRLGAVAPRISSQKDPATAAAQKFEAFVLQSWLENFLPKAESGAFGSGGAGNVWRSMMAEQLGAQIASAGGLGLQKLLASPLRETNAAGVSRRDFT